MTQRSAFSQTLFTQWALLTAASFLPTFGATQSLPGALPWDKLATALANEDLLDKDALGLVDAPAGKAAGEPDRIVVQWIRNQFYRWEEYDKKTGDAGQFIILRVPEEKALNADEAAVLLSASTLWMKESFAKPGPVPQIPRDDPSLEAAPSLQVWTGKGDGTKLYPNVDDRTAITSTSTFPYNTVGYIQSRYSGYSIRGSGAIVGPNCVLTCAHNLYDIDVDAYAGSSLFRAGQYQTSSTAAISTPFGSVDAWRLRVISQYTTYASNSNERFDYDLGAFLTATRFTHTTTYIPVVFGSGISSGTALTTAGYPAEVRGTGTYGLWQSTGTSQGTSGGTFSGNLYASGGNSGGPVWEVANGNRRIVAVFTYVSPGGGYTGGTRLTSSNRSTVESWIASTGPTPPANDNFANGIAISGATGSRSGSNSAATTEASEPTTAVNASASVWFRYTPTDSAGLVTMTTCGSSFDTVLSIYTGSSLANLTLVEEDDDGGCDDSLQSAVTFPTTRGTVYHVAVRGYDGATGSVALNWSGTNISPAIALASPAGESSLPVGTTSLPFSGTASDPDGSVSEVRWRLNGGVVQIASGTASWSFTATGLLGGTNTVEVWSRDARGAESPIASRTVTVAEPRDYSTWYFAEGAALDALQTFILLANQSDETLTVDIDFLVESGANRRIEVDVPPRSRRTVEMNNHVSNTGAAIVARERFGREFAAERAVYARTTGGRWNGAHSSVGITRPSAEWYFAEGATELAGSNGEQYQTFILIANPNSTAADVQLTFLRGSGEPITRTFRVDPNRRLTVEPGKQVAELARASFSTRVRVTNGLRVVAERAMWWQGADFPIATFVEGHASPGLTSLSRTWYFAEGDTSLADEFLLLANTSATESASVTLRYLLPNAAPMTRTLTLAPNQRYTLNVTYDAAGLGVASNHGTAIESSIPIAAERSMYWFAGRNQELFGAAHNNIPTAQLADRWLMPEGFNSPEFATSIKIANPGPIAADLTVRFLPESGESFTRVYTLAAERSLTIETREIAELASAAFSTEVTSTAPIVTERVSIIRSPFAGYAGRAMAATCSLGIPFSTADTAAADAFTTAELQALFTLPTPTPTPTPTATPLAW